MPAKLVWLDPTVTTVASNPTPLTSLDFGNIVAPGFKTLAFKLGNIGDAAAEDVTLSIYSPEGDLAYSWKHLSVDGGVTFSPPLSEMPGGMIVANLAPQSVSGPIYLKSQPPAISDSVPTGVHASTLVCDYVYV